MSTKNMLGAGVCSIAFFAIAAIASAHVIVKPAVAGIGEYTIFTMSVPAEKDTPTISLRLLVPDGLQFITPNVKPGWRVNVKTEATGKKITNDDGVQVNEMKPVEIDWTGGSIPPGERDEFSFEAQTPAAPTTLNWKAYQIYADGSSVSWNLGPTAQATDASGPYSHTDVIDDLSGSGPPWWGAHGATVATALSLLAILLAALALSRK